MQVPQPFDKEEIRERLRKLQGGPTGPLNVHLRQELDRLNIILRITATTLKNLRLAVAGTRLLLSRALVYWPIELTVHCMHCVGQGLCLCSDLLECRTMMQSC